MNTPTKRDENERMMAVEIELSVEEMEEVIAPGWLSNHNEVLLSESVEND